jgi:predicted O-linked N-acetylglucosamine transferase (SPINDLY family)
LLHGAVPREAYLAAYAEVDMVLDTFPHPGGTTTCEALWMGVPTLTLAGDTMLARQGASLLAAAGLEDWVATSVADYVDKAVVAARNLPKLAALRAGLREQASTSPLFDARRFTRNLEEALWGMWQTWLDDRQKETA